MKKKPEDRQTERIDPPAGLNERSKRLWGEIVPRRARSAERLELVRFALTLLDRVDLLRAEVERDGLVVETLATKTRHVNPAAKLLGETESRFLQVWRSLGLEFYPATDGRFPWSKD